MGSSDSRSNGAGLGAVIVGGGLIAVGVTTLVIGLVLLATTSTATRVVQSAKTSSTPLQFSF